MELLLTFFKAKSPKQEQQRRLNDPGVGAMKQPYRFSPAGEARLDGFRFTTRFSHCCSDFSSTGFGVSFVIHCVTISAARPV